MILHLCPAERLVLRLALQVFGEKHRAGTTKERRDWHSVSVRIGHALDAIPAPRGLLIKGDAPLKDVRKETAYSQVAAAESAAMSQSKCLKTLGIELPKNPYKHNSLMWEGCRDALDGKMATRPEDGSYVRGWQEGVALVASRLASHLRTRPNMPKQPPTKISKKVKR